MGIEIERKFLTTGDEWRNANATYCCQGYLNPDKQRTVRVRIAGDKAMLTIKGPTAGASRQEFEYQIPVEDAQQMMKLVDGPVVTKNRYIVEHSGLVWEVDEFLGDNEGLVVAEVELESEQQEIEFPDWVGEEVTSDKRYFNSSLSVKPFKEWD